MRPRGPRLVLVTDRRQLVARVGAAEHDWPELLVAQIRGAIDGGVDLVQVREPDLDARALSAFLRRLFAEVPASRPRVVVNDRVDVALAVDAAGVHLPERSYGVSEARALAPVNRTFVIGRSVHDAEAAHANRTATYLLAGTVRESASKPEGWRTLGWDGLRAVVEAAGDTPVVAIGGLGVRDVPLALAAGASGIAAIAHFLPGPIGDLTKDVQDRVIAARLVFDSVRPVPYTQEAG